MAKPTPIMILSDPVTSGTGLGRITNDIASRIAEHMPETFRVATASPGGINSRHLPFHQYNLDGVQDFVCPTLPEVWQDFAGDEKGIIFSIWDASRLAWLSQPKTQCEIPRLREFLLEKPFHRWIYAPIDASGPNDRLTYPLKQSLIGFDRVLAYGRWAAEVVDRTLDRPNGTTEFLPHGIDTSIFYERNRKLCRKMFVSFTGAATLLSSLTPRVESDETLIGILATNQSRKNWALGLEACAILAKTRKLRIWIKIDALERYWSIPALLVDYGLVNNALISLGNLSDSDLAKAYSACDVVLGIAPEGFGYVHVEATACGCPIVVGSYAGGAELVPKEMHVDPEVYHYEGVWTSKRPVYQAWKWAAMAESWIGKRVTMNLQYDWAVLWPRWERYLVEAVNGIR